MTFAIRNACQGDDWIRLLERLARMARPKKKQKRRMEFKSLLTIKHSLYCYVILCMSMESIISQ